MDTASGHVMLAFQSEERRAEALTRLDAFQAFVAGIRDRCEVQPVTVDMHPIGSYRLFDAIRVR